MDKGESREAQRTLERMQDALVHLALGLSYHDFVRFRQLAGEVVFTQGMEPHSVGAKEDISESEAEFALAFAIESILSIESAVGDIEKPFGLEWWR